MGFELPKKKRLTVFLRPGSLSPETAAKITTVCPPDIEDLSQIEKLLHWNFNAARSAEQKLKLFSVL